MKPFQFSEPAADELADEGVSATVKQTPGGIGYVELIYAVNNKLPVGSVRNKAGKFVTPTFESVTAAAAGAVAGCTLPSAARDSSDMMST